MAEQLCRICRNRFNALILDQLCCSAACCRRGDRTDELCLMYAFFDMMFERAWLEELRRAKVGQ